MCLTRRAEPWAWRPAHLGRQPAFGGGAFATSGKRSRPTLFAVSVERPGGVVVSGRERLPLVAKAPPPNAG